MRLLPPVVTLVALGLALVLPGALQAATFRCSAGNVACLIAAINEANANGEENIITLAAGTYTLTASNNGTVDATGLPVITSPLTIQGARAETTIIERDANAARFRLLRIATTGTLTIKGLTLRGGKLLGGGGGIFNVGTLTLTNCILTGNTADGTGGGGLLFPAPAPPAALSTAPRLLPIVS